MSVNFTSDSSVVHPQLPSNNSELTFYMYCIRFSAVSFIYDSFHFINMIVLLPLCTFILHHGLQHWWRKRSTSSAASISHSDCFTYHMVTIELIGVCGCFWLLPVLPVSHSNTMFVGLYFFNFTWCGQMCFHIFTCVDRYLAVVHPITYLSLRNERGIRIRSIIIACAWLLSMIGMYLMLMESVYTTLAFCLSLSSITIVSYCSLSVLRVLIRPRPGGQGNDREPIDQSKQRAFRTIVTILGVLALRFTLSLVWAVLYALDDGMTCVIVNIEVWFNLPSSLVLPLLFLHRAEKLAFCKKKKQRV